MPTPQPPDDITTPMKTQDVTPAQITAIVVAFLGLLAGLGLPLSEEAQRSILAFALAIPTILTVADSVIRHGRAKIAVAQVYAAATPKSNDPEVPA